MHLSGWEECVTDGQEYVLPEPGDVPMMECNETVTLSSPEHVMAPQDVDELGAVTPSTSHLDAEGTKTPPNDSPKPDGHGNLRQAKSSGVRLGSPSKEKSEKAAAPKAKSKAKGKSKATPTAKSAPVASSGSKKSGKESSQGKKVKERKSKSKSATSTTKKPAIKVTQKRKRADDEKKADEKKEDKKEELVDPAKALRKKLHCVTQLHCNVLRKNNLPHTATKVYCAVYTQAKKLGFEGADAKSQAWVARKEPLACILRD